MRVGLVVPGGFDRGERIIPVLHALTRELSARHEVHVLAQDGPSGPGRYELAGARVEQLARYEAGPRGVPASLGRIARLVRALARLHDDEPLDVLHAFWAGETATAATLFGRRARVRVVVSVGGGEAVWLPDLGYGGAGSLVARTRTRVVLRLADAVTVGSEAAADPLRALGVRPRIVPLGVHSGDFTGPAERPIGPPWKLLQVADLNAVKDQQMLLDALAIVASRLPGVTLDLVGDDTLGGRIQQAARDRGVATNIGFHGFVPHGALAPLYRGAHLNVVSSRYESQGVAVLEAATAGLPTVGTDVGYLKTMAPDAAVVVPVGDAPALADAICALLHDDTRRHAIARAAQKLATECDAAWTARTFESLYAELR